MEELGTDVLDSRKQSLLIFVFSQSLPVEAAQNGLLRTLTQMCPPPYPQ